MMTKADIHTLTGAYALDALTEQERTAFERHLRDCPGCAQEVHELRLTAAQLGMATAAQPPDELKQRVLTAIASTRQLPPEVAEETSEPEAAAPVIPLRARRWPMRAAVAAAAAAIVAAGVLGGTAYDAHEQLQQTQSQLAAISGVLGAPDARTVTGTNSTGASGRLVMSPSEDRAVFLASGLPAAPPGHTYQAWMIGNRGPVSMGLLGSDGGNRSQPIMASGVHGTNKIGITVEPTGGSRQPTTSPVLLVDLS